LKEVEVFEVEGTQKHKNLRNLVFHAPELIHGGDHPSIYFHDCDNRPFASDGTKYFFFVMAVLQAMKNGLWGKIDVIHLHDWHASSLRLLAKFEGDRSLPGVRW